MIDIKLHKTKATPYPYNVPKSELKDSIIVEIRIEIKHLLTENMKRTKQIKKNFNLCLLAKKNSLNNVHLSNSFNANIIYITIIHNILSKLSIC